MGAHLQQLLSDRTHSGAMKRAASLYFPSFFLCQIASTVDNLKAAKREVCMAPFPIIPPSASSL